MKNRCVRILGDKIQHQRLYSRNQLLRKLPFGFEEFLGLEYSVALTSVSEFKGSDDLRARIGLFDLSFPPPGAVTREDLRLEGFLATVLTSGIIN